MTDGWLEKQPGYPRDRYYLRVVEPVAPDKLFPVPEGLKEMHVYIVPETKDEPHDIRFLGLAHERNTEFAREMIRLANLGHRAEGENQAPPTWRDRPRIL